MIITSKLPIYEKQALIRGLMITLAKRSIVKNFKRSSEGEFSYLCVKISDPLVKTSVNIIRI